MDLDICLWASGSTAIGQGARKGQRVVSTWRCPAAFYVAKGRHLHNHKGLFYA